MFIDQISQSAILIWDTTWWIDKPSFTSLITSCLCPRKILFLRSLWSFGKGLFFDLNHDTSYTDISRWMKIYISKKEIIKTSNNLKLKIKENKSFIFSLLTSSVSEYVHSTIFAHELPCTLKKRTKITVVADHVAGATGRHLVTDLKRELRTELGKEVLRKWGQVVL